MTTNQKIAQLFVSENKLTPAQFKAQLYALIAQRNAEKQA